MTNNLNNKPKFNSAQLRFQPTSTAIATANANNAVSIVSFVRISLQHYYCNCNTSIAIAKKYCNCNTIFTIVIIVLQLQY